MARNAGIPLNTGQVNLVATQFAKRLALISFSTTVLRGLIYGPDFLATMQTALVCLGAFYVLGLILGEAARRIVEENIKSELARQVDSALAASTTPRPA
jgi:hypothetical protein